MNSNRQPTTDNRKLPAEPREALIRWGVLCGWLREWGIGEWTVRRLVREGRIQRIYLDGGGRAFFAREQVKGVVRGEVKKGDWV